MSEWLMVDQLFPKTTPPLVIPKPNSGARSLLTGGEAADSSRDPAALQNDNSFGDFKLPDHG
jgi:hypothetical protein